MSHKIDDNCSSDGGGGGGGDALNERIEVRYSDSFTNKHHHKRSLFQLAIHRKVTMRTKCMCNVYARIGVWLSVQARVILCKKKLK